MGTSMYVGIDIGGTKTLLAFGDADGRVHERQGWDTEDSFDDWYMHVSSVVGQAGRDLEGIGIGSIGPVDYRTGVIRNPPAKPRWRNVPVVERLRNDLGVERIFLENDCNAAVL